MNRDAWGEAGQTEPSSGQDDLQFGAVEPPTSKGGRHRISRPTFEAEASIVIQRPEDVLLARSAAELLCSNLLGEGRPRELLAHIVSELGQNILKHATDGTIAISSVRGAKVGLEIFAHDRGPGIEHLQAQLIPRRVWSLVFEPGLRGIKRLAHEFDIDTSPRGTHVRVVMYR